jgi:hypothetical protein
MSSYQRIYASSDYKMFYFAVTSGTKQAGIIFIQVASHDGIMIYGQWPPSTTLFNGCVPDLIHNIQK